MSSAVPVQRGCGSRQEGGVYAEVGIGPGGLPLEHFLICPPILLNQEPGGRWYVMTDQKYGVKHIGVTLVSEPQPDDTVVYHVADWIGASHYANVWDFLAEAQQFGVSRRLSKKLDFSKLSKKSRLLCIHNRAAILNHELYTGNVPERFGDWAGSGRTPATQGDLPLPFAAKWKKDRPLHGGYACPKNLPGHEPQFGPPAPCCIGVWGQDIEGGEELTQEQRTQWAMLEFDRGDTVPTIQEARKAARIPSVDGRRYDPNDPRLVVRKMPSVSYVARRAPDSVEPAYHPAIFASFPLSRLVVVKGEGDADAMQAASASSLTLDLEDQ